MVQHVSGWTSLKIAGARRIKILFGWAASVYRGCYPARELADRRRQPDSGKLYRGKAGYSASAAPIFTKLPPESAAVFTLIVIPVVI